MSAENTLYEFIELYPEFFDAGFEFQCEDGWYELVEECLEILDEEKENGHNPKVTQIKEKFGLLRFYADGVSASNWWRIHAIETKSSRVCEYTGTPGELHYFMHPDDEALGWMKTVSRDHAKDFVADDGRRFLLREEAPNIIDRCTVAGLKDLYGG